jgi:hypothetical protein
MRKLLLGTDGKIIKYRGIRLWSRTHTSRTCLFCRRIYDTLKNSQVNIHASTFWIPVIKPSVHQCFQCLRHLNATVDISAIYRSSWTTAHSQLSPIAHKIHRAKFDGFSLLSARCQFRHVGNQSFSKFQKNTIEKNVPYIYGKSEFPEVEQ